jgi:hypothetical protein
MSHNHIKLFENAAFRFPCKYNYKTMKYDKPVYLKLRHAIWNSLDGAYTVILEEPETEEGAYTYDI